MSNTNFHKTKAVYDLWKNRTDIVKGIIERDWIVKIRAVLELENITCKEDLQNLRDFCVIFTENMLLKTFFNEEKDFLMDFLSAVTCVIDERFFEKF